MNQASKSFAYILLPDVMLSLSFSWIVMKIGLNYIQDIWFAGIGAEYKWKDDLALKGGVKYLEGASNDNGLRADTVDVDTIHPTVGFAYDITETKELNVSIMYNIGIKEKHDNQSFDQDHLSLIIGLRF